MNFSKSLTLFSLGIFFFLAVPTTPAQGIEACDFYQDHLEAQIPCGPKGYALGYGRHYCRRYMARIEDFSPRGETWVREVMGCLQTFVRGYLAEQGGDLPGCQEVKLAAFDSHPGCYTSGEVSFCELKARDYWQIGKILSPRDTLTRLGLRQIKEVAKICLMMRRSLASFAGDPEAREAQLALRMLIKLAEEGEAPVSPLETLVGTDGPGTSP